MGKIDGKPTVTTRVAISADGKTMTATQTGMNAQGQSVNNVIVLDKGVTVKLRAPRAP